MILPVTPKIEKCLYENGCKKGNICKNWKFLAFLYKRGSRITKYFIFSPNGSGLILFATLLFYDCKRNSLFWQIMVYLFNMSKCKWMYIFLEPIGPLASLLIIDKVRFHFWSEIDTICNKFLKMIEMFYFGIINQPFGYFLIIFSDQR